MPIKYIGRTHDFKGKTLWEILGNLKNFGVGRIVVRNRFFQRYSEPTYHRILKVEALPAPKNVANPFDDLRKVMVLTEKIFRGRKATNLVQLDSSTYKTDYLLIPKEDEERFCNKAYIPPPQRILPKTMEFPPLMKEIFKRQMKAEGKPVTEPRLTVKYNLTNNLELSRIAEEGETPDFEIQIGLGNPVSPNLYKNIKK